MDRFIRQSVLKFCSSTNRKLLLQGLNEVQQVARFSTLKWTRKQSALVYKRRNRQLLQLCRQIESESQPQSTKQDTPVSWQTAVISIAVMAAIVYYFKSIAKEKEIEKMKKRSKIVGKAAIGGDWELIDMNGKLRSNKDFYGQWVLLYFGFTHCPDICPEELEKVVEVVDNIDNDVNFPNITPLFVTVDRKRDSPAAMKEYCKEYSPKIIGLTGDDEQIRKCTRAYRIYFSAGPEDDDGDYIVDHSIITYLINPDGDFTDFYGQRKTARLVIEGIKEHMKSWEKEQKEKEELKPTR